MLAASSPDELIQAVHDNLRNLDVDVLDVVNLRNMFDDAERAGALIEAGLTVLADLQRQGLVRHIGLSNVTPAQIAAGRRICDIVCVQNRYNLAHRSDDELIDALADDRIAYVPYFPLGRICAAPIFNPIQRRSTPQRHDSASGARMAASPSAKRSSNSGHVVVDASPGESRGGGPRLSDEALRRLDSVTSLRSG